MQHLQSPVDMRTRNEKFGCCFEAHFREDHYCVGGAYLYALIIDNCIGLGLVDVALGISILFSSLPAKLAISWLLVPTISDQMVSSSNQ